MILTSSYTIILIRFLSVIFIATISWLSVKNSFQCQKPAIKSMTRIHSMLHSVSAECRHGNFERAQNTYLDLHLEWQRMEVSNKKTQLRNGFSSDSLIVLGQMIDRAAQSPQDHKYRDSVNSEIMRITNQLDL